MLLLSSGVGVFLRALNEYHEKSLELMESDGYPFVEQNRERDFYENSVEGPWICPWSRTRLEIQVRNACISGKLGF